MNSYSKLLSTILHNNKHLSRGFLFGNWLGRREVPNDGRGCKIVQIFLGHQKSILSIFFCIGKPKSENNIRVVFNLSEKTTLEAKLNAFTESSVRHNAQQSIYADQLHHPTLTC